MLAHQPTNLTLFAATLFASSVPAAQFTVTTDADGPAGSSPPGSLREAIEQANNTAGPDEIFFAIPGPAPHTITLTADQLDITDDLTLSGTGKNDLRLDGNNASRVIATTPGTSLTVSELTIQNAAPPSGDGGGIAFSGGSGSRLSLFSVRFSNNSAPGNGGGIAINDASFDAFESSFENNSATNGGAVSLVRSPDAAAANDFNSIFNSTLRSNTASGAGGAVFVTDTNSAFDLFNCVIIDNSAAGTNPSPLNGGGALFVTNTSLDGPQLIGVTISASVVESNRATGPAGFGGAVHLHSDDPEDSVFFNTNNSTYKNNTADEDGGAIKASFPPPAEFAEPNGLDLFTSAFVNNAAGGPDSTHTLGGTISIDNGRALSSECTIVANDATGTNPNDFPPTGGIAVLSGELRIENSVISDNNLANPGPADELLWRDNGSSSFFSNGANHISGTVDLDTATLDPADLRSPTPHDLAPLAPSARLVGSADDQLPIEILTPLPTSALVDAAPTIGGSDQIGTPRPDGSASDIGAVEFTSGDPLEGEDYGDAPDSYATNSTDDGGEGMGPSHTIAANLRLGTTIDNEPDGNPTFDATGDDFTGQPDEDALDPAQLTFAEGTSPTIDVAVLNDTGSDATLGLWIDLDGNGIFDNDDPGEEVITTVQSVGAHTVQVQLPNIPAGTLESLAETDGRTFLRLRLSTVDALASEPTNTGEPAPDGEVEDWQVIILPPDEPVDGEDYGDAPDSYATDIADDGEGSGPAHSNSPTPLLLGFAIDTEPDGIPTPDATGDDSTDQSDEDAILDPAQLIIHEGTTPTIDISALNDTGSDATLGLWIDLDGDGRFNHDDPAEQVITTVPSSGAQVLHVTLPPIPPGTYESLAESDGITFLRLRLSTSAAHASEPLNLSGTAPDGEVEDWQVVILPPDEPTATEDYGDAPDSYATDSDDTGEGSGPAHTLSPQLLLGNLTDAEPDGLPSPFADGDDTTGQQDEDALDPSQLVLEEGTAPTIDVLVTNDTGNPATLGLWIDLDANGTFDDNDPDEEVITNINPAGTHTVQVQLPLIPAGTAAALASKEGLTFLRLRLCSETVLASEPRATSGIAPDGEVEDWAVYIAPPAPRGTIVINKQVTNEPDGTDFAFTSNIPGHPGFALDHAVPDDADATPGTITLAEIPIGTYDVQELASLFGELVEILVTETITANAITDLPSRRVTFDLEDTETVTLTFRNRRLFDFGDLPDAYHTTLALDGARHSRTPAFLGESIDTEPEGQASPSATEDDLSNLSDEDGVEFLTPIIAGRSAEILFSPNQAGWINAWVDWNMDGDFDDTIDGVSEQIFSNHPLLGPGFSDALPILRAPSTLPDVLYCRYRFTSDDPELTLNAPLPPQGHWPNGEVEDYALGSIAGRVWLDEGSTTGTANNGIREIGEPFASNIQIALLDITATPVLDGDSNPVTTTTDASGIYQFNGLPPADYLVQFTAPAHHTLSPQNVGLDDTVDSDADPTTAIAGVTLAPGQATGTTDAGLLPPPVLSVADSSVDESTGTLTFTLTLSYQSTAPFSFEIQTNHGTTDPTDLSGINSQVMNVPPGSIAIKVDVTFLDDLLDEDDETFTLALTTPTGIRFAGGANTLTATATIIDDDPTPSLILPDTVVPENAGPATFTATLSGLSGREVTVAYTTADGTAKQPGDYTATTGSLTIPRGQPSATIPVPVISDNFFEPQETFTLTLSSPTNVNVPDPVATARIVPASTLSNSAKHAWGENIGYTRWRDDPTFGGLAVAGRILTGFAWAENVGYLHFGDGSPANGRAYASTSATDYGVNLAADGTLTGHAWGGNIGWVRFEQTHGKPRIKPDGTFAGHAWGENVGWIGLSGLRTTSIQLVDADGDNIDDHWEIANHGNLTTAGATTDTDRDGVTDAQESIAGTDPNDPNDYLRITTATTSGPGTSVTVTFPSNTRNKYRIETNTSLTPTGWQDSGLGLFTPDSGTTTTKAFTVPTGTRLFYRIATVQPLSP